MKLNRVSKLFCFLLTLIFITISMPCAITVHAEAEPVKISRTVSTTCTDIGEKFMVSYHITGDRIQILKPKKEIAVVIDCSGSMSNGIDGKYTNDNSKKRITIARNAAKNFISYFNNNNTKIFVEPYSSYAGSVKAISDIKDMRISTSLGYLNNYIDSLNANGSTNTGDALRIAYYKLIDNGAADAQKYIVLLTDGEPHGYTYKKAGTTKVYYTERGLVNNSTILKDDSDSSSNDTFAKGYQYSRDIGALIKAERLKDEKLFNTFIIGFAQNDTSYNQYDREKIPRETRMDEIGKSCGADPVASNNGLHFYKALTANDLTIAYDAIKNIIGDTIPFSFMTFSDILPAGVDIDEETRQYLVNDKNFVIEEITYGGENRLQISAPLDTVLKRIAAESTADYDVYKIDDTDISFEIQVLATKDGIKRFEKNVTKIDYTYSMPDGAVISDTACNTLEQDVEINLLNTTVSMLPNNTLLLGCSKILEATVNKPEVNKVAEWLMSRENIIALSDNRNNSATITGTELGSVTVTARTKSENGWYREGSAACNVNVVDVSLDDIYVLKGITGGISLPLNISNTLQTPVDVQIAGWSVDPGHNDQVEPYIEIDKTGKRIQGLRGTGDSPINLSLTVQVEQQQKTINAKVHVLDLDIPQPLDVLVFQEKQFDTVYSVPDDSYKSMLSITGEFKNTTDSIYAAFDSSSNSRWKVNGISLKNQEDTTVELKVVVKFNNGVSLQQKELSRIITVKKPAIDIN